MGYSAEKSVKSSFLVAKNGKSLRKNIFISLLYRYTVTRTIFLRLLPAYSIVTINLVSEKIKRLGDRVATNNSIIRLFE